MFLVFVNSDSHHTSEVVVNQLNRSMYVNVQKNNRTSLRACNPTDNGCLRPMVLGCTFLVCAVSVSTCFSSDFQMRTTSTPRSDSASVRESLAEIRSKLSFQLSGTTTPSTDALRSSFDQPVSRFRQRPLFTFGSASALHRDANSNQQSVGGTPLRSASSDRPQTPLVNRSPSSQYLLSTQRELERVQREKHEWERKCMELEATNNDLLAELQYLGEAISQGQQTNANPAPTSQGSYNEDSAAHETRTPTDQGFGGGADGEEGLVAVSLLKREVSDIRAQLEAVSRERDMLLQQTQATGSQLEVLMKEYEKEKRTREQRVAVMQAELDESTQACGKALRAAEQLKARHDNEVADLESSLDTCRAQLRQALEKTTTDDVSCKDEVDALREALAASETLNLQLEGDLEDFRSQLIDAEKAQAALETEKQWTEDQLALAKTLCDELTEKAGMSTVRHRQDFEEVAAEKLGLESELEMHKSEVASLTREAAKNVEKIADLGNQLERLDSVYVATKSELEARNKTLAEVHSDHKREIFALRDELHGLQLAMNEALTKHAQLEDENEQLRNAQGASATDDDFEEEDEAVPQLTAMAAELSSMIATISTIQDHASKEKHPEEHASDSTHLEAVISGAEEAFRKMQQTSHATQMDLQSAIEDCANALQERQQIHVANHKEQLRQRDAKRHESMERKIEDVEAAYEAKIGGLESLIDALQEELRNNDNEHEDDESAAIRETERLGAVLVEANSEIARLKNELSSAQDASNGHHDTEASLEARVAELTQTLKDLQEAYHSLESQHEEAIEEERERMANTSQRDVIMHARLTALTDEYETVVAERDDFRNQIEQLKAKYATAAITNVSTLTSPSSPSAAWPSASMVGANIQGTLPVGSIDELTAVVGTFESLLYAAPHVYDHTCWAFDAMRMEGADKDSSNLLLRVACSTYAAIVDSDNVDAFDATANSLGLPNKAQFLLFVAHVFNGYHGRGTAPYHSRTHAADVLQMAVLIARNALLPPAVSKGSGQHVFWDAMTPLDRFSFLVAALTHDFNHPGKNNRFLARTRDPIAVRYSGQSILEQHHAAATFLLCQDETIDITKYMSESQRELFHHQVTFMILGTDMAHHREHVADFMNKAVLPLFSDLAADGAPAFDEAANQADRLVAMRMLLHAADVGNSARPFHIARKWGRAVRDEFFAQGVVEKGLGLTPSVGCDEAEDAKAGGIGPSQLAFIDSAVMPLWHVLVKRYGLESPGREKDLIDYRNQVIALLDAQQEIIEDAMRAAGAGSHEEATEIDIGMDSINEAAEAFAWRGEYGLQMMVDAIQVNRLMWVKQTPAHFAAALSQVPPSRQHAR